MCQRENRQERVGQCMMVQAESTETFLWGRGRGDASVATKKIHHSLFIFTEHSTADIGSMSFHTYLLILWCFFRPRIPLTSALSSRCYWLQGGEGQLDIGGGQRRPPTKSSPGARSLWRGHLRHSDDALCVHHLQTAGIWFIIWFFLICLISNSLFFENIKICSVLAIVSSLRYSTKPTLVKFSLQDAF